MKIDPSARYSKEHEWVRKDGEVYFYGITDHAQDQLSDIVFVEFPEIGESFTNGDIRKLSKTATARKKIASASRYMPSLSQAAASWISR